MATTQQSPFDYRLLVPLQKRTTTGKVLQMAPRVVACDETEEPNVDAISRKPKATQRPDPNATLPQEVVQWKLVENGNSATELNAISKNASEQIGDIAEEQRQVIATGKVLQGETRAFSDNLSLIRVALLESQGALAADLRLPHVELSEFPYPVPRSLALASAYLKFVKYDFDADEFSSLVIAVQQSVSLQMAEVWNLKPFLEFVLLEQIANAASERATSAAQTIVNFAESTPEQGHIPMSTLAESLRRIVDIEWKQFFEQTSETERALQDDPQGAYGRMDFESREAYRSAVTDLASYSRCTEQLVVRKAIDLAREAERADYSNERIKSRRTHVGYYLMGSGQSILKDAIGYRPPMSRRVREAVLRWSDFFYLIGIELTTLVVITLLVSFSRVHPLAIAAAALFLLPAVECAVAMMNLLATRLAPPRKLPRLDFSKGIPKACATVVAIPTLLASEEQVRSAVHALEVRFLANRDPHLHFALLTDVPDSTQEFDDKDALAGLCSSLIDGLNGKYGHTKKGTFFHFHRNRVYNPSEEIWMGWERKRGKLLDFNRFLLGQSDRFPVKTGDMALLSDVRYVITLDLDTQLPADAAHKLVGTIAHPLNRAVIDAKSNTVVEGYGVLQPRVDISIRSASRSRFASLLSGDAGVDLYTRAVSDVYQDLFGEGIFTGKGIYEVETFHKVLEHRFPCNAVLSHDLIEGIYARTGLVSDIVVVDDYPSHFSAYSRRKHRWVRGDWQIIFGLLPRVPDFFGKIVRNPMSHISRWKIIDNLRRSLMDLAIFMVFLCGWLCLPGRAGYWTLAALALMLFPTYFQFLVSISGARGELLKAHFWKSLFSDFATAHFRVLFRVAFLCHQTLVTVDAVVRTLIRMKFTHKRLLQWETAADAEVGTGESMVDAYLRWTPLLSAAIGVLVYAIHPGALQVALPVLVLWASSRWICKWFNQPQRSGETRLSGEDRAFVRNLGLRTWRFFREFSTADENWLVPDIVQPDPPIVAHRISTTNLGLLLNARQAACDFGFLTLTEFVRETAKTLETIERLPKFRGHLYNWYTTDTLEAVEPRFISTVDNGNLVCSLWTTEHGCLEALKQPLFRPVLWQGIHDFVELLVELAAPSLNQDLITATSDLQQRVHELSGPDANRFDVLSALEIDVAIFAEKVAKCEAESDVAWWAHELSIRVAELRVMVEDFAPWLLAQFGALHLVSEFNPDMLTKLSLENGQRLYEELRARIQAFSEANDRAELAPLYAQLLEALDRSISLSQGIAAQLIALADSFHTMANEMDFGFLYNPTKKQISIGYDGSEGCVSKYHYDLLASEARAAVFVAIAKGDIPQESWFELGRSYIGYKGEDVLRSWTGTAFEYLMPCLWMRTYTTTLLERCSKAAIRAQKKFVRGKGIPWGISESSCNQRNPDGHYRYHAFGVPGLAINRDDCSGDVVIAPYATFLALPFEGAASVRNLRKMKDLGWLSAYGFYEAADFTPRRVGDGKTHEVVRNWMAHHQGMSLVAIANALCDSAMLRRFHAEPCVLAHERLLHERYPRVLPKEKGADEVPESAPNRLISLMGRAVLHPGIEDLAPKAE